MTECLIASLSRRHTTVPAVIFNHQNSQILFATNELDMQRNLRLVIALLFVIGIAGFFLGRAGMVGSGDTVDVLVWTSGEKQNILQPALERFNTDKHTISIDNRRYVVNARSVTVNSGDMYKLLIAKLNQNAEFPSSAIGPPTVVSPSTSDWLAQVNLEVGHKVFDVDNLKSIVRTPVVIFTYKEMAECLGWPQRAIGWSEILNLAESADGWAACPTAKVEWGKKPLVAFTDPTVSSTARSTLQLLTLAAAGVPAEQFRPSDVNRPEVRDFVKRFQATVDHYYPETLKLQTKMFQGPHFLHFAPVEEYTLPWLYQGKVNAESVPGGQVQQRPITDLGYNVVAIYPKEGTVWHDNPFAIPNEPWVTHGQREAAKVLGDYLWSEEIQRKFMEWGFRPGTALPFADVLTPKLGVDPQQPKALVGRLPSESAKAIQDSWRDVKKSGVAVLVLDTSGSMSGTRLDQAKQGAKRFIDAASPNTHVGLVTFSGAVETRVPIGPLSQTRFAIAQAVDTLTASGQAALYEATKRGVDMAGSYSGVPGEAIRGVVLLSDGAGNAGQVGLSDFIQVQNKQEQEVKVGVSGGPGVKDLLGAGFVSASKPGNPVHIFSVGIGEADWETLRIFAEASGGVVVRGSQSGGGDALAQVLELFSKYF
ncbi:MAG: VWA domain-containing protein [Dehalococcoidia bacterium]|nr:VWA domain-containing protein [Dehalococcoidia bacterium]